MGGARLPRQAWNATIVCRLNHCATRCKAAGEPGVVGLRILSEEVGTVGVTEGQDLFAGSSRRGSCVVERVVLWCRPARTDVCWCLRDSSHPAGCVLTGFFARSGGARPFVIAFSEIPDCPGYIRIRLRQKGVCRRLPGERCRAGVTYSSSTASNAPLKSLPEYRMKGDRRQLSELARHSVRATGQDRTVCGVSEPPEVDG